MKKLIIFMLLIVTFPALAQAASGKWSEVKGWTITANTDNRSCFAATTFEDGVWMSIMFIDNQAHWVLGGLRVIPNQTYNVRVQASNGAYGTMQALATNETTAGFPNLNQAAIRALADARFIEIQGLGRYNLYGSKAAMAEAWNCYMAIQETL